MTQEENGCPERLRDLGPTTESTSVCGAAWSALVATVHGCGDKGGRSQEWGDKKGLGPGNLSPVFCRVYDPKSVLMSLYAG